ncbi:MAG: hypothetical protein ACQESG_07440 [Nanobdellota archaeon]
MDNRIPFFLSIAIIIFSVTLTSIQLERLDNLMATGNSVNAGVQICINRQPVLVSHNCTRPVPVTHTGELRDSYSCSLNATDPEGTQITYVTNSSYVSVDPITGHLTVEDNIAWNGTLLSIPISLSDQSECLNNRTELEINLSIQETGQVLFTKNYPSTEQSSLTLTEGFTSYHNILDDHFRDIDGYALNYTVERLTLSCYSIGIDINATTHQVIYSVPDGSNEGVPCQIRFHGRNPYGDKNVSNTVTLDIEFSDNQEINEGDEGGETGGGGESGGGMPGESSANDCVFLDMNCTEWSDCTYQDPDSLPIKPGHFVDWNLTNDGIITRHCTWKTNCPGQLAPKQKKQCDYVPTCNDSMKNCHEPSQWCEEGIDCGGPCDPCANCSDWIQNCVTLDDGTQVCEEGIDCGGLCGPCATCSDGMKNCLKLPNGTFRCEDGIDCGGPCEPCASCDDMIKNCHRLENGSISCEDGIDCGGPCPACLEVQKTSLVTRTDLLNLLLLLLIFLGFTSLVYRIREPLYQFIVANYIKYIQRSIMQSQQLSAQQYLQFYENQLEQMSNDFDTVTDAGAKEEGDRLLLQGSTSGYNIDRYSVSFDNDYADILTDNSVRTINYAFYASDIQHGKRILKELLKAGIKPNYSICKRSSTVEWDERWKRDEHAHYDHVDGRLMARTVEYILTFKPKDEEETNTIIKILESYGKGKESQDGWDIPDIRVTGTEKVRDFEKQNLNIKSVGGQKLMALTKDRTIDGYESTPIWVNSALSRVIK